MQRLTYFSSTDILLFLHTTFYLAFHHHLGKLYNHRYCNKHGSALVFNILISFLMYTCAEVELQVI